MSRIKQTFARLQQQQRKALIPFITAGDPGPNWTLALMHQLVESGADLIELGVPFSDPMADGPAIQAATERALAAGMSLIGVLDIVRQFREVDQTTPIILMGYLNPVESMGYARFAAAAEAAGVDAVLTVDLPPEEADTLLPELKQHGIDTIFLLAPTTTDARIELVCSQSSGFVYYVSLKGVTGAGSLDVDEVRARIERIKARTSLPVGVGFGIRDAQSAAAVGRYADAVVVGSVLVNKVGELAATPEQIGPALQQILSSIRAGLDQL
jgi:tryptophan synthase alpha chain